MKPHHPMLLALLPAFNCGEDTSAVVDTGSSSTSSGTTPSTGVADSSTIDTEESSGSSGSSSTTGPMPCVSDEECTEPEAPFCGVTGECGTCDGTKDGDAACAGLDPKNPVCVGDACVQCTAAAPEACTGETPLCDDATNTCVPCNAHDQCGEAACNLYTGACLPADAVVHVGGATPDFPNLTMAVASFAADGAQGTIIVHQANYDEAVTVDGGRVLAFLAADGDTPAWAVIGGGAPQLAVTMGSTVLIDGLRMSGNANDVALMVDSGRAWLDRTRVIGNLGGGIVAQNAAELTLRNCFVGINGGQFVDTRGITASNALLDIRYTTLAANDGTAATGPISMSCDAASTGEVRNSIVAAGDDTIACANVSFSFNVVDTSGLAGSDNDVLSFAPAWFPNIAMSDFHVGIGPPFADVAQWQAGDPPVDIDGDLRPTDDGSPDYAGADVP
jgi:hypothetical protein